MTVTLQVYDEIRSAILFDLNDLTGGNSGSYGSVTTKLVNDLDLGSPQLQSATVEAQDIDATYSAFSKRATAPVKAAIWIAGSSYDNLTLATGTLANYLTQGCVLKYISGTNTYLIDVLPSPTPALVAGQEDALYRTAAAFQVRVDIELVRQPYLRMAGLTAATNLLTNSTLLRDTNVDGLPDLWSSIGAPTLTIPASTQSLHVVAAATNKGVQQDTAIGSVTAGLSYTWSADLKVTSGTGVVMFFDWRTAASANISTDTDSVTAAQWTRVSGTHTAPGTASFIRFSVQSNGAATYDLRNIQIEQAAAKTPYRVAAQTVNLDPATSGFSKMLPVYNPGTAPAPMTITTAFPDASTNVQAMDYFLATSDGVPGNKYLSDYLNGPYYAQAEASGNGWTLTAGTDTTLAGAADATHSPGSGTTVARITHATNPNQYNERITFTRSTLLDCLRGKHRVFAAVKPAAKKRYRLQLAWSAGSATTETNDEFFLKQTDNLALARVLCDLGTIELPENTSVSLNALTMKLYTKMGNTETASNLDIDYLMLVPQDNSAHVELVNATGGLQQGQLDIDSLVLLDGADGQVPKDLGAGDPTWVTGATHGTAMRLNSVNEAVGIGSTTTGAWTGTTGGVHVAYMVVQENDFIGTYNVEVANCNDNDLLDVNGNTMSRQYVRAVASNVNTQTTIPVFEENTPDFYQPRVTITSYTSGGIDVWSMSYWLVNALVQNQQIRTDPGSTGLDRYAAERLDSSSFYVGQMSADRVPFWLPPGLSLLWLEAYDLSVGGAELPHLNARTLTVTPTVYPRFWA